MYCANRDFAVEPLLDFFQDRPAVCILAETNDCQENRLFECAEDVGHTLHCRLKLGLSMSHAKRRWGIARIVACSLLRGSVMFQRALTLILFGSLTAVASCTAGRPNASAPVESNQAFAEHVAGLRKSLLIARTQLDSMVAELHRVSGDASPKSDARATELLKNVAVLDSSYRTRMADFLWVVNSSNLSSSTPVTTRFPFDPPPSPLLQPFADGEDWVLQSRMIYRARNAGLLIVIVPRGFVTDYASIPRPLRVLLPNTGAYGNAAIVHDYLYWRQDCTRSQSDNIMAIAMRDAGVGDAALRAIQIGVRLGGQGSWDKNREDRQSGLVRTVGPPFDQVPPGGTWDAYREWIRTQHGGSGVEYAVPLRLCAMGDSLKLWN